MGESNVLDAVEPKAEATPEVAPLLPAVDPADAKKVAFLLELVGTAGDPAASAQKQSARQATMDKVRKNLDDNMASLMEGMKFELIEKNPGVIARVGAALGRDAKVRSLDPDGDPNKEFETGNAVTGDFKALPPSVLAAVKKAHQMVMDMAADLRGKMDDGGMATTREDGTARAPDEATTPMFSEADIDGIIAAEIWQPLVRSRTIPENAVPSRYSEVAGTFKGASDAYRKRLKKYSLTAAENDDKLRQSALGQVVFNGMNTMSGAVIGVLKDQIPGGSAALVIKEVADCQALIASLGVVAFGVADQVLKQEFDPNFFTTVATAIGSVTTVAGDGSPGQKANLAIITSACTVALKSGQFLACIGKGDMAGAVKAFGSVVGGIVSATNINQSGTAEKDAGKALDTGISSLVDLAAAAKAFKEGRVDEAGKLLTMALTAVTKNAVTTVIGNQESAKETALEGKVAKDQGSALSADQKRDMGLASAAESEKAQAPFLNLIAVAASSPHTIVLLTAADGSLKKLLKAQVDARELKTAEKNWALLDDKQKATILKMQSGAADAQYAANQEEAEAAKKDFGKLIKAGDPVAIEKLIAKMQLQKVKINLAVKLMQLPFAVIGAMFPPAQMGQSLILLANEMRLLLDTADQYLQWADNVQDARKSGSVQAEAMTSRMDLSFTQSVRHGAEAALNVLRIIGQGITIAGGPVAHIGIAIDKSAQGAQAAKQIIVAIKDYKDAASAWEIYEAAFDNPENRTAIRAALRQNPTLAKYAIAYGAKIANNRIAANALAKCGISDEMLNDEGSGVDKLVTYLEARFDEDPIVLRAIPYGKWHPGDVELTGTSWLSFVQAAQTEAKPKLTPPTNTAAVATGLGGYGKAKAGLTAAGDTVTHGHVDAVLEQLALLRKALVACRPLQSNGKPHAEFHDYITGLVAQVAGEIDVDVTLADRLKTDESAYQYLREAFDIQHYELDALPPANGSDLAKARSDIEGQLADIRVLEDAGDWAKALAALRIVKTETTTLLQDTAKAGDEVAKLQWDNAELLQKARDFGDDAPDTKLADGIVKAKADLDVENTAMGAAQKQQDWTVTRQHLDTMLGLAKTITGGT